MSLKTTSCPGCSAALHQVDDLYICQDLSCNFVAGTDTDLLACERGTYEGLLDNGLELRAHCDRRNLLYWFLRVRDKNLNHEGEVFPPEWMLKSFGYCDEPRGVFPLRPSNSDIAELMMLVAKVNPDAKPHAPSGDTSTAHVYFHRADRIAAVHFPLAEQGAGALIRVEPEYAAFCPRLLPAKVDPRRVHLVPDMRVAEKLRSLFRMRAHCRLSGGPVGFAGFAPSFVISTSDHLVRAMNCHHLAVCAGEITRENAFYVLMDPGTNDLYEPTTAERLAANFIHDWLVRGDTEAALAFIDRLPVFDVEPKTSADAEEPRDELTNALTSVLRKPNNETARVLAATRRKFESRPLVIPHAKGFRDRVTRHRVTNTVIIPACYRNKHTLVLRVKGPTGIAHDTIDLRRAARNKTYVRRFFYRHGLKQAIYAPQLLARILADARALDDHDHTHVLKKRKVVKQAETDAGDSVASAEEAANLATEPGPSHAPNVERFDEHPGIHAA